MLRLAKKPAPFPPSSPEPAREEAEAPGQAEPEPRDLEPESAAPEPPVAPPREETVVAIRAPDRLPSVDEVDPALDWLRAGPAKPSIHPPAPAKFDEPAPPDAAAPPATLRQFESGGVNYTLYANGSILAESPEGQLRFADMTELRAHLARREPREPA